MVAKRIVYSRLISKGDYQNCKIELELEVEPGEKAADVFNAAKEWVNKRVEIEKMSDYTLANAHRVLNDRRNHTLAQIEDAEEILKRAVLDDQMPF